MAVPAVVEHLSLPMGFTDRRGRGTTRHRNFTDHTDAVLRARPAFLTAHGGRVPRWIAPPGLRTVLPLRELR